MSVKLDSASRQVYIVAVNEARMNRHEYVTPEHFLYAAAFFEGGKALLEAAGGSAENIKNDLTEVFTKYYQQEADAPPSESLMLTKLFQNAAIQAEGAGKDEISTADLLIGIFTLPESHAAWVMERGGITRLSLMKAEAKERRAEAGSKKQESDKGLLAQFAVDMTEAARKGLYDKVIGREDVLARTVKILCRRVKNNALHVGDAGVGKTAVAQGLAQMLVCGGLPKALRGAKLYSVDMPSMVAGTRYRGDFEERLTKLLSAAEEEGAIIYIDEIHNAVGAGAISGGAMDAAGILKPFLSRGKLRVIGSTTFEDYKRWFEKDAALSRRFCRVDINEPSPQEALEILKGLKPFYEDFHGVKYTDGALAAAVELSKRYIANRRLPDKAIDVIDEAAADNAAAGVIDADGIERAVAQIAGLPEASINEDEKGKLVNMEEEIKKELFGQDTAVKAVCEAVKAARAGLGDEGKPIASFLFVGPTGVGKTELARRLAVGLSMPLNRFDMSEYQEKHACARLIGSPPGYVGYEEGGLLTDTMRKSPRCVLLLDEIEKAHIDVLNVLLSAMDYGIMTDNAGRKADFTNCIIIYTSNAGARELGRETIGFGGEFNPENAKYAVEKAFTPEFRNRLDEIVYFNFMDMDMARRVAKREIGKLAERLAKQGAGLVLGDTALERIANAGLSKEFGAREIIRVINRDIRRLLTNALLDGGLGGGVRARLEYDDGFILTNDTITKE